MSTLKSNTIEPATGTNLSLGAAGDLIDVTSDTLQLNTWKDSGGNTLFVSDGSGNLSSINSALDIGGGPNLILSQTADASSSISFTANIDSTYDKYMFVFANINPSADAIFEFNGSIDGGSNYNVTKTSTFFRANHEESGASAALLYAADNDLAQGTGYQDLVPNISSGADENCAGILYLYAPSSTTYVKQFYCRIETQYYNTYLMDCYIAGYFNTTSAITAMDFKMSTGNFDGKVKMYGCR